MNRTYSTRPLALWAALFLNGPCLAIASESTHREHGAHEHGHGVLEVVTEGAELVIALRIPAVNAVGFEHAPSTEQQHRRIEEKIARFRLGERLFVASGAADCRLVSADAELAGMPVEHGEAHDDGEHEKDAHSSEAHDKHAKETHFELHAEYRFRCASPARLEAIEVGVFDVLDGVEEIEARVVTETFQGAADLTARSATLKLAR